MNDWVWQCVDGRSLCHIQRNNTKTVSGFVWCSCPCPTNANFNFGSKLLLISHKISLIGLTRNWIWKKNKGERPQISGLHFLGKNYSGHQQDIRKQWDNTGLNRRSICEINFVKPKLHIGKQTSSVVSLHCNVLNSFLNVTALEFSFGRHPFSKVRADWLREWSSEEGHLLTEAKNEMLRTGPWFANVIVWNN